MATFTIESNESGPPIGKGGQTKDSNPTIVALVKQVDTWARKGGLSEQTPVLYSKLIPLSELGAIGAKAMLQDRPAVGIARQVSTAVTRMRKSGTPCYWIRVGVDKATLIDGKAGAFYVSAHYTDPEKTT